MIAIIADTAGHHDMTADSTMHFHAINIVLKVNPD